MIGDGRSDIGETASSGRLAGRVVLLTGGGSGIGRHYARRFVAEGARVAVADVDFKQATETVDELNDARRLPCAVALEVDVTSEEQVAAMVAETLGAFGTVDVLVNNVGTYPHVEFDEITLKDWRNVMSVNLDSVFLCSAAVLPTMKEKEAGKIVNVATNLVWVGLAGMVHYIAAKAGVVGFTRALAREVGDHGITVNAIAPGAVAPPIHLLDDASMARLEAIVSHQSVKWCQRPADLLGAMVFLASEDSDFMSGQVLTVDGGLTNH